MKSLLERFWDKVRISESGCWEWQGASWCGYGHFRIEHKTIYAHRFSFELSYGVIPEGKLVCHHCDNPACVNPSHMFMGTQSDNMKDCFHKGRITPPVTSQYGETNGQAKLTAKQAQEIRELFSTDLTCKSIAKAYGISSSQVWNIGTRRNWA